MTETERRDKIISHLENLKVEHLDRIDKDAEEISRLKNIISGKSSIVNNNYDMANVGDFTRLEDVPKQIRISDYIYAFVQNENASGRFESIGLFMWASSDWVEVSDLTELKIWEYKTIHKYAVAIGWIDEDKDLFI